MTDREVNWEKYSGAGKIFRNLLKTSGLRGMKSLKNNLNLRLMVIVFA